MVHLSIIEARLSRLGIRLSRWFRPELRELQHILMDHEKIVTLSCGRYFGGYAMLVATDQRLLLVDKKSFFMTVEDIRYDMVSEIDFSSRLYDSTLTIFTVNKQHRFTSVKYRRQLRQLTSYVQKRIMELRQYGHQAYEEEKAQRHFLPEFHRPHLPNLSQIQSRIHLPHPRRHTTDLSQKVGSAALRAGEHININPYVKGSLVTKSQWSRSLPQPE